jgi:hypothetical protein
VSLLAAAREVRASRTWIGLAGRGRTALIDHRDVAEAGLRVLVDPALWGAHHELTGPAPMTGPEALELLSAARGEPVTFRAVAERQLLQRLTEESRRYFAARICRSSRSRWRAIASTAWSNPARMPARLSWWRQRATHRITVPGGNAPLYSATRRPVISRMGSSAWCFPTPLLMATPVVGSAVCGRGPRRPVAGQDRKH